MSRTEQDLVGTMAVDADAYYGIHSLRAAENFSITGRRLPGEMIVSMASIKKACAGEYPGRRTSGENRQRDRKRLR